MSEKTRRRYVAGITILASLSFASTFIGNPSDVPLARLSGFFLDVRPFRGAQESLAGLPRTELSCRGAEGETQRLPLDRSLVSRIEGPHSRLAAYVSLFTDSGRWKDMKLSEDQYRRFRSKAVWWGLCGGREWARAARCPSPTAQASVLNRNFRSGIEGERVVSCAP